VSQIKPENVARGFLQRQKLPLNLAPEKVRIVIGSGAVLSCYNVAGSLWTLCSEVAPLCSAHQGPYQHQDNLEGLRSLARATSRAGNTRYW